MPDTVVIDVGNVLVEWDPRRLYRRLIPDAEERERFLSEVCTLAWNDRQDRGRPLREATAELQQRFPEQAELVSAYYARWPEMLGAEIEGTVAIVDELRSAGVPVYALTNFSAETFPIARERCAVLRRLDGVVVSGEVGMAKPDPEFFHVLVERYGIRPDASVFIDDNPGHVAAASHLGFDGVVFTNPGALRDELVARGLPIRSAA